MLCCPKFHTTKSRFRCVLLHNWINNPLCNNYATSHNHDFVVLHNALHNGILIMLCNKTHCTTELWFHWATTKSKKKIMIQLCKITQWNRDSILTMKTKKIPNSMWVQRVNIGKKKRRRMNEERKRGKGEWRYGRWERMRRERIVW